MPPKKTSPSFLIVKVKRQSSTYVIDVTLKDTVTTLKEKLVHMINSTNGIKLNDQPVSLDSVDAMNTILDNPNIEVPKIGLNDSDSENDDDGIENGNVVKDNDVEDKSVGTELNDNAQIEVSVTDVCLGTFDDINDIYRSKITELDTSDETKIDKLNLQDFVSIAFRYKDEEFRIYKPQYD